MTYISTFFSHFGAVAWKRFCDTHKMPARMMPVPRSLSSSCGTCVRWEGEELPPQATSAEEVEQVVELADQGYVWLYRAQGS